MDKTQLTYVDPLGSDYQDLMDNPPIWGTELIVPTSSILDHKISIQTARFWTDDHGVGSLEGIRTEIKLDDLQQIAQIVKVSKWTAHTRIWVGQHGLPVPVRHRRVLSAYLQDRWQMQRLRGRIRY